MPGDPSYAVVGLALNPRACNAARPRYSAMAWHGDVRYGDAILVEASPINFVMYGIRLVFAKSSDGRYGTQGLGSELHVPAPVTLPSRTTFRFLEDTYNDINGTSSFQTAVHEKREWWLSYRPQSLGVVWHGPVGPLPYDQNSNRHTTPPH